MERATGIRDPALDAQEVPKGFESWFLRYFELRTGDGLSYSEIRAYEEAMNTKLSPIEVSALMAMDRAAAQAVAELLKESVE